MGRVGIEGWVGWEGLGLKDGISVALGEGFGTADHTP